MSFAPWKSVTKLLKSPINKAIVVVLVLALALGSCGVIAASLSYASVTSFRQGNWETAAQRSSQALVPLKILQFATLNQVPDILFWQRSLEVAHQAAQVVPSIKTFIPASLFADPQASGMANSLAQHFSSLQPEVHSLATLYPKTWFIQRIIIEKHPSLDKFLRSSTFWESSNQAITALSEFFSSSNTTIFLLQNSEELRATGGFIGSFGVLSMKEGLVEKLSVQDIYEPDGQFTGYMPAPPGVEEYLSAGKGLRLPDSNWSPDFPTAAQTTLQFLALGKVGRADHLIAMNVNILQDLLEVTGPIALTDYPEAVTAENITQLARADRSSFFPGSQQKKIFLQALLNQLKWKLSQLSPTQTQALLAKIPLWIQQKDLQGFSREKNTELFFHTLGMSGQLQKMPYQNYLMLVESNVGINKVNPFIHRQIFLRAENDVLNITAKFENTATSSGYINYQRVLVLPSVKVSQLKVADQIISSWDEEIIQAADGNEFKQIGFVAPIAPLTKSNWELTLSNFLPSTQPLFIQKQSGLPPVQYTVQQNDAGEAFSLDQDRTVSFP